MNKTEILQILLREQYKSPSKHWSDARGKLNNLEGERLKRALDGINRYIRACQSYRVKLEPNPFVEILDDASKGQMVWLTVNDDKAILQKLRDSW